ncbi:MAG: discoidin domain-containing protein [Elusimicrobiota bacterium]
MNKGKLIAFILSAIVLLFASARLSAGVIRIVGAVSSSIEQDRPEVAAKYACDGKMETRWASQWSDPQWIYFDLGSRSDFNLLEINWEAAYGKIYEVYVSNDAGKWEKAAKVDNSQGGKDIIYLGKRKARYIKILGIERGMQFGYSIFEVKVRNEENITFPGAPEKMTAKSIDDAILLTWDKADNAAGYDIYRSADGKESFEKINKGTVLLNRYADINVEYKKYYYYVRSIRYFGQESQKSEIVSAGPRQPVPPAPSGCTDSGKPYYEGLSKNNFGRYGWLTYPWEKPAYTVTYWEQDGSCDGTLYFTLAKNFGIKIGGKEIRLVNRGTPKKLEVDNVSWVSKTVNLDYELFKYKITFGLGSPGVLIQSEDKMLTLECAGLSNAAFVLKNGAVLKDSGDLYNKVTDGPLKENWVLFWDSQGRVPLLVVLKKMPSKINLSAGRVNIYFEGPFEQAVVSGIYGVDASNKELTADGSLKSETAGKCRFWSRASLAYPVECKEYFWMEDENSVGVRDEFSFLKIKDDWGTEPQELAPVSPLLSFAKDAGYPVTFTGKVIDYDFPTWYGPLRGVAGTGTVEYILKVPPVQHRTYINAGGHEDFRRRWNSMIRNSLQYWAGGYGNMWKLVPEPIWENSPMSKKNLDPYTWMGVFNSPFNAIMFLDDETRTEMLKAADERIRIPFTKYSHLMPAEVRIEPYTKTVYTVYWWNGMSTPIDKYWDMDEESSCALQALYCYALYTRDWETVKTSWKAVKRVASFLESCSDWAYMGSGCREEGFMTSIDMLNSTYPGLLAYSKLAKQAGDEYIRQKALYMAAKAAIPSVMRLKFRDYAEKYNLGVNQKNSIAGFGEFGPATHDFSEKITGYVGITYLDSARGGLYPELISLYTLYAKEEIKSWINKMMKLYPEWYKDEYSIHFIYAMSILGMETDKLEYYLEENLKKAEKVWICDWPGMYHAHSSAPILSSGCPFWLTDSWIGAKYVSSFYYRDRNMVELVFDASGMEKLAVVGYSTKKPLKIVSGEGNLLAENESWTYNPADGNTSIVMQNPGAVRLSIYY